MFFNRWKQVINLMDCLCLERVTLIDVGARWDIHKRWQGLLDRLYTIGFEPDREECQKLNSHHSGSFIAYPLALADKAGTAMIHITEEPGRSSLYLPNSSFLSRFPDWKGYEIKNRVEVSTTTLDSFLLENKITDADFMKLDVQGGEMKILEGGMQCLRNLVFGIEVEVEFSPIYVDQPLFSDVDRLCRQAGFELFDLKPAYLKRVETPIHGVGQLVYADALYFKDYIQQDLVPAPRAAAVALVASCIYHKFDYAFELLNYFYENKLYPIKTYKLAEKILHGLSKFGFPFNLKFRGRLRAADILDRVSQKLRTAYWARWDDWKT